VKRIQYRVLYNEGDKEIVTVLARDINGGFAKAIDRAREPLGSGRVREIARIEFWQLAS
jgi:hypothetical protein